MLSLLLTLFISLFSICPSYDKVEDHIENVIVYNDSIPIKNFGYYDDDTIDPIYYYFQSDLMSDSFITTFITTLSSNSVYANFNPFNLYTDTLYFSANANTPVNGVTSKLATVLNVGVSDQQFDIYYYKIEKLGAYGYDGVGNVLSTYRISLENQNHTAFITLVYRLMANLTDSATHNLGVQCVTTECSVASALSSWFSWCIIENTNQSVVVPFTDYYARVVPTTNGYQQGLEDGYQNGLVVGKQEGYQQGYSTGYNEGVNVDSTASTIFTGVLDVALIPVNVFLTIFNFEVFGINIGGIVSGLLTLSVVIIILRFLFGGKKDD